MAGSRAVLVGSWWGMYVRRLCSGGRSQWCGMGMRSRLMRRRARLNCAFHPRSWPLVWRSGRRRILRSEERRRTRGEFWRVTVDRSLLHPKEQVSNHPHCPKHPNRRRTASLEGSGRPYNVRSFLRRGARGRKSTLAPSFHWHANCVDKLCVGDCMDGRIGGSYWRPAEASPGPSPPRSISISIFSDRF